MYFYYDYINNVFNVLTYVYLYEVILYNPKHSICIFHLYSNSYICSSSISPSNASDTFAVLFLSIRSNHGIICKTFHWTTAGCFSRNLFCDTTNVFSDFRHVNFFSSFMSSKQFSLKLSVSGKTLLKLF